MEGEKSIKRFLREEIGNNERKSEREVELKCFLMGKCCLLDRCLKIVNLFSMDI